MTPAARGRGVGRALMAAVAAEAVHAGTVSLEWGVRIMSVDGAMLRALADRKAANHSAG